MEECLLMRGHFLLDISLSQDKESKRGISSEIDEVSKGGKYYMLVKQDLVLLLSGKEILEEPICSKIDKRTKLINRIPIKYFLNNMLEHGILDTNPTLTHRGKMHGFHITLFSDNIPKIHILSFPQRSRVMSCIP